MTEPDSQQSQSNATPAKHPDARVLVLSGPSGSGKTTIVNRLVGNPSVSLMKAISATTRPPRQGEIDGQDYYFLSQEEFDRRRKNGEFLECAEVFGAGYWYGTLWSELQRACDQNAWAFLEVDVEGALNVMREYPQAVTIFLTTPSAEEYERRLRRRGTESEEVIQRRLQTAAKELQFADRYKHIVVNDDLDRAVAEILDILKNSGDTP
ncbi:MAG: guanylate kinase [Planctomycetaceae bacterium]